MTLRNGRTCLLAALVCACGSQGKSQDTASTGASGGTGAKASATPDAGANGVVDTGGEPTVGTGGAVAVTGGTPGSAGGFAVTGGTAGSAGGGGATGGTLGSTGGVAASSAGGLGAASGEGGTAAGGSQVADTPPQIGDLAVEPNPNNVLSCYASWTTDVAASSEVQFGIGEYAFRIVDEKPTTTHRVLVIGMYASSEYLIKAISANSAGVDTEETSFETGALPSTLPEGTLSVSDSASQPGWTLTNIMPAGAYFPGTEPGLVVMYDHLGVPVWYFVHGSGPDGNGDVSVEPLPNGNIMVGASTGEPPKEIDLAGNVVWQGPPQPETERGNGLMSHETIKLDNGHYVLMRENTENGIIGALLEEVTPDNEVVWSWNLFDQLQPPPDAQEDWCHPNAITIDLDEDVLYLSCRYLGVIKAHRSGDQSIIWILGDHTDDGDFAFDPSDSGFADQHEPEIHDDGTILLYDNGGFDLAANSPNRTRVVEYALDEQALTARLLWEFPGDFAVEGWLSDWYTAYWGDADRLANGNVLVTAGTHVLEGRESHIFELNPQNGQVVWDLVLPSNAGTYQSERLSPPPLVEAM